MSGSKIIGIDLGTTNSCAAILEAGQPQVIINSDGDRTTPSIVGWDKNGERIVGKAALRQQVLNPDNTIYSVKRFIGRTYSDLTLQDLEGLHYNISEGERGRPVIHADNRDILPEEISAAVLSKIKADCEKFLGIELTEAVITVPAYFDDNQRQATKDAGKIAGLNVLRIINEPTAAAMAYGFQGEEGVTTKVLVFDLGGGTFDVSILDVDKEVIQVISTAGDNHLGGDVWDSAFCEYLCDRFEKENGVDLRADAQTHSRVLEAAREAKCDLSTATTVQINLPFITAGPSGPLHLDYEISREEFEEITRDLLERCRKPIQDALDGTPSNPIGLKISDIDEILLVGGSTRMPAVLELVRETFGKNPCTTVNPDEVVAMGAAIQGGVLNDECNGIVLSDVNSMSVGIKTYPNSVAVMIPANTPIPADHTEIFTNEHANQDNVQIVIVQGENPEADGEGNKILGDAVLPGDGRSLREVLGREFASHELKIEITISYNVDGLIELKAREQTSEISIDVKIEGTTKLEESEVKSLAAAEKIASLGSTK